MVIYRMKKMRVFFQLIIVILMLSFAYNNSIFAQGYGDESQNELAQAQDKKEEPEEEDDEDC